MTAAVLSGWPQGSAHNEALDCFTLRTSESRHAAGVCASSVKGDALAAMLADADETNGASTGAGRLSTDQHGSARISGTLALYIMAMTLSLPFLLECCDR
ncbi:hypothetical protein [Gemmatimonas sp.]|uniref:hypothetical protein n=1 Tax=Gemmatimonas sp. TaxID=1962908 RepID=UPI00286ACA99|nr:hypothetical protein [Gemmatimonas sp.]